MSDVSLLRDELSLYVCSANDALDIRLVRQEKDLEDENTSFHPELTHQVYGENESIFGYKDLKIQLYYTAGSLATYFNVNYKNKIDPIKCDGVEADDVVKPLAEHLSPGFLTNIDEFCVKIRKEPKFKPFGDKLHEITIKSGKKNRVFEFYHADITETGFREFYERLQVFVFWFIDAASLIDLDDDRWRFFLVFEKYELDGQTLYATVGFTTIYHYYAYPDKVRPRISQMLILPPFQKKGLGTGLLETIYDFYKGDPKIVNITVEVPSDDFIRLRDFVDAKNCLKLASFESTKLHAGFSSEMVEEAQAKLKLNKKQARKIYEILRLHFTDLGNQEQYKRYRIDVKSRLNVTFKKQEEDLNKFKRHLSPDEIKSALNCMNKDHHLQLLNRDYEQLEGIYRQTIERLAAAKVI